MDMVSGDPDLFPESLENSDVLVEGHNTSDTGVCTADDDVFFVSLFSEGSVFSFGSDQVHIDDAGLFVPPSDLHVTSEKVLIRKEKNRQCAKKSRQLAREWKVHLEQRTRALEEEVDDLNRLVQDLKNENRALKSAQHDENIQPDLIMGPTFFLA